MRNPKSLHSRNNKIQIIMKNLKKISKEQLKTINGGALCKAGYYLCAGKCIPASQICCIFPAP